MKHSNPSPVVNTLVPFFKVWMIIFALLVSAIGSAQSLDFSEAKLIGGKDGEKGAQYLFKGVAKDVLGNASIDCIVTINDHSGDVELKSVDIPVSGNGAAFQPLVKYKAGTGDGWLECSFSFLSADLQQGSRQPILLPFLIATFYGLEGYEEARSFVECDLGRETNVVVGSQINNLEVTQFGTLFRTENKQEMTGSYAGFNGYDEKISFFSHEVGSVKVRFGLKRNGKEWSGEAQYNLEFSEMITAFAFHRN